MTRYRLQELMDERGMSARVLSRRSHTSPATIHKILAGLHEPQPATLERLAEALGVTPEELVAPTQRQP
jgi:transcriptional regulator with XRE-family HTH domain